MTENLLKIIDSSFPLHRADIGSFSLIKAGGMTFHIKRYDAEGLGVVSLMSASGMLGLMKMETLIINPIFCDAPLYSYDGVTALGKRTEIFEIYDTMLGYYNDAELMKVKKLSEKLPEHSTGEHWYDSIKMPSSFALRGGKKHFDTFDKTVNNSVSAYVLSATAAPACNPDKKLAKASVYVDGLLEHGGPSTDIFKKSIGDAKTAGLYRKVLFGTDK